MNKEIKDKWVKALTSGKYKQTTSFLKDNVGYCCLGVLCDIYRKETKKGVWVRDEDNNAFAFKVEYYSEYELLPKEVKEWANLTSINPTVTLGENEGHSFGIPTLADINDNGKSFKDIAEIIMKQL